jgi:phage repressor protein C with HTH and peptisase S24 domain
MSSNKKSSLKNPEHPRHLERLRIIKGDDMFPSICPGEILLLDRSAEPKAGDVVLFTNRFGMRIGHRLIYVAGKYH